MSPNVGTLANNTLSLPTPTPPRRTKRARSPVAVIGDQAGSDSGPADDGDEEDDDDAYVEPKRVRTASTTTTSARGARKHTKISRAARDAQRKANHSIIEKARRTKINDALATLSILVPDKERCESGEDGKEECKNKEFKLEILLRTVDHLRLLTEKVKVLESATGCSRCSNIVTKPSLSSSPSSSTSSSTTLEGSLVQDVGNDAPMTPRVKQQLSEDVSLSSASASSPVSSTITPLTLPSISTWLPHIGLSTVCIPSGASNSNNSSTLTSPFTPYLPSPPPSGSFRTRSNSINPPSLILPPPNLLYTSTLPASGVSAAGKADRSSPLMSPEDESAAALLLQIKTSPLHRPRDAQRRKGSADGVERSSSRGPLAVNELIDIMTPSSFLGI